MAYAERYTVTLTTDSSGDATGYTPVVNGKINSIHYVKTDFADGVDFTITSEATGQGIWTESNVNASTVRSPHQPTHAQDGTALLYAAAGLPVDTDIYLANDRIKIVVASGGDTKTGTFYVVIA